MYQFGHRDVVVPGTAGGGCSVSNSSNCLANSAGLAPGSIAKADISAWLFDVRGGFQIGPLLIEGMYMFSSGNKARDTTLNNVHYFQPLTTDTGYLADWGTQLSALGLDYLNAQNGERSRDRVSRRVHRLGQVRPPADRCQGELLPDAEPERDAPVWPCI